VILAAVLIILAIAVYALARRTSELDWRLAGLTQGHDGRNLEGILDAHLEKVREVAGSLDDLSARTRLLETNATRAFQRVGLVRFNPFEDTGGNQSFALALLDAREDGFVISSLHSRSATRFYAKAVVGGWPEAALSDEEAEAVKLARTATLGRAGLADRVGETERGQASPS
jgi:Protein of unknown function (DUF4446)